jgi:hypothetical protein
MSAWLYSLHPPRENFAATMTDDEVAAWNLHFKWLGGLLEEDQLVLAGASLGAVNTGIAIFEAPSGRSHGPQDRVRGSRRAGRLRARRAAGLRGGAPARA